MSWGISVGNMLCYLVDNTWRAGVSDKGLICQAATEVFMMATESDSPPHKSSLLMCMCCLVADNENSGSVLLKTRQTEWETAALCRRTLVTATAYCQGKKLTASTSKGATSACSGLAAFSTYHVLYARLSKHRRWTGGPGRCGLMSRPEPVFGNTAFYLSQSKQTFLLQTNIFWQP